MKELKIKIGSHGKTSKVKIDGEDIEVLDSMMIDVEANAPTRFELEGMFNPRDETVVELEGYYLANSDMSELLAMIKSIRDYIEDLGYDKMEQYPALRNLYIQAREGVKWMPQAK
jgi:hypothetical protein